MKMLCALCGDQAELMCRCESPSALVCEKCAGEHSSDHRRSHVLESIDNGEGECGENQAMRFLKAARKLQKAVATLVDNAIEQVESTIASSRPGSMEKSQGENVNEWIELLRSELQSVFSKLQNHFPTVNRPFTGECEECISQRKLIADLQEQVARMETITMHETVSKNFATENVDILKQEKKRLHERISALESQLQRLRKSEEEVNRRLRDFADKAEFAERERRKLLRSSEELNIRLQEAERDKKQAIEETKRAKQPPTISACAHCQRKFNPSGFAPWRFMACLKTPQLFSIIPDLCSENCYSATVLIVRGRSWWRSLFS